MRIDAHFASPLLTARSDEFARAVRYLSEACIYVNREYLAANKVPALYSSGITYRMDYGRTELLDIAAILEQGWAYCLSLACWRIAELRESGIDSKATIAVRWKTREDGLRFFHVLVRRGNGREEDPSKILGM